MQILHILPVIIEECLQSPIRILISPWLINEISDSPFLLNKFYDRHISTVIKQRVPLVRCFFAR